MEDCYVGRRVVDDKTKADRLPVARVPFLWFVSLDMFVCLFETVSGARIESVELRTSAED